MCENKNQNIQLACNCRHATNTSALAPEMQNTLTCNENYHRNRHTKEPTEETWSRKKTRKTWRMHGVCDVLLDNAACQNKTDRPVMMATPSERTCRPQRVATETCLTQSYAQVPCKTQHAKYSYRALSLMPHTHCVMGW